MPGGSVQGKIVSVTEAGNLVTDIAADTLKDAPRGEQTIIRCDEHETCGLFSPDHQEPAFTFLAILNAAGQLELAIVGESARDMLGLRPGMEVVVQW
jgi:S-adenosyl-L-methionine hydrolase (adenosine-forming)